MDTQCRGIKSTQWYPMMTFVRDLTWTPISCNSANGISNVLPTLRTKLNRALSGGIFVELLHLNPQLWKSLVWDVSWVYIYIILGTQQREKLRMQVMQVMQVTSQMCGNKVRRHITISPKTGPWVFSSLRDKPPSNPQPMAGRILKISSFVGKYQWSNSYFQWWTRRSQGKKKPLFV